MHVFYIKGGVPQTEAALVFNKQISHHNMLHIAFEKSADSMLKKLVKTVAGPYVHTEMVLSQLRPTIIHTAYAAYTNSTFCRVFESEMDYQDQTHDFLHVQVQEEELLKISKTCEACVETKIPYNTRDMVLSIFPFRNPTESDIFHTNTLFCSQSIVLILRSCLDQNNPIIETLSTVNSRTITPSQLYNLLSTCCRQASTNQVIVKKRMF